MPSTWRTNTPHGLNATVILGGGSRETRHVAPLWMRPPRRPSASTGAAKSARDGKGHRADRPQQAALRRRTKAQDLPCGYGSPSGWGCGEHIDTDLSAKHRTSFTADHDTALANGGRLAGGLLVRMNLSCNSRKNDHAATEIRAAS